MFPRKNEKALTSINQRQSDVFSDKPQTQPLGNNPNTKIHRAAVLFHALNSVYLYKMQDSMDRIKRKSKRNRLKYIRMRTAINGVFRRHDYNDKFESFYKIKKIMIQQRKQEIQEAEKVFSRTKKSAAKLILLLLKNRRTHILTESMKNIKSYSLQAHYASNASQRKSIRTINRIVHKNMKWAFGKLHFTQLKTNRKFVLKKIFNIVKTRRKDTLQHAIWKLKKNVMLHRNEQVLEDIKIFEEKIESNEDPEMLALREKRQKLEEHAKKIQEEHQHLQEEMQQEVYAINEKKQGMNKEIQELNKENEGLKGEIKKMEEEAAKPYSLDEIFQCLYNNMLFYLHENQDRLYNKEQVLKRLKTPLIPLDVPLDKIKEENQAMQELLNQYIIMFGDKRSEVADTQLQLPYEYLVKENYAMYKMLLTLLPLAENDRDGLNSIKDGIFKLECKVKELWSK